MTDELLAEFQEHIESWTLIPSDGGRFEVEIDGRLVYSKLETKRHAEIAEIQQLIRQAIDGK